MTAKSLLASKGLRSTQIRISVVEYFMKEGRALAHHEIEKAIPDADRVTLYRTFTAFEEKGLLHQVIDEESYKKYALCSTECSEEAHVHDHVHFKCTTCGQTTCLDGVAIPAFDVPAGFQVAQKDALLTGICPKCQSV